MHRLDMQFWNLCYLLPTVLRVEFSLGELGSRLQAVIKLYSLFQFLGVFLHHLFQLVGLFLHILFQGLDLCDDYWILCGGVATFL